MLREDALNRAWIPFLPLASIQDDGHEPIFDGKTSGAWDESGDGWSVENGALADRRSEADVQPKPHVAGEWNAMTVSARRHRNAVHVNVVKVSDTTDAGKRNGKLVLDLLGGTDGTVLLRDIERLGVPR
jgi:hypothetical protein